MPTERRKIQNRINQRRYRMQTKNRIQMLEKAIIDSGVAAGLELGLSKSTATENDDESSGRQSFSTPSPDLDVSLDLDLQNLMSFDLDPSPDSFIENNFFASQDFLENVNQQDLGLNQETTSPILTPNPIQQSRLSGSGSNGSSHRLVLPLHDPSNLDTQSDYLERQFRTDSIKTASRTSNASDESLYSTRTRSQSKKASLRKYGDEAKKSKTGKRKARDPKEKIIAFLREENKRLKELSTAMVTMYDCTAKPLSAGQEVAQCHKQHATVKKLITHSFSNNALDSVQVPSEYEKHDIPSQDNITYLDLEQSCSPTDLGLAQLAMQDLEFAEVCAELTGCFDQRAGPIATPGAWDSHPDHPHTTNDSNSIHFPTSGKTRHLRESRTIMPTSYCPTNAALFSSMPLPTSHAYLEATFSRRLVRLLWEYAFSVLTGPHIAPTHLNRCFGHCLRFRTKETLINKFKAYLGLRSDPISELDMQAWNTAPDVRDSRDDVGDEWDYWLEAGKVEKYLESLGFSLTGKQKRDAISFVPVVSQNQQLSGSSGVSPRKSSTSPTEDEIEPQLQVPPSMPAPQVPYGSKWQPNSCITNTLFDANGNFHVPASWLVPSASEVATPERTYRPHADRLVQQKSGYYLDVNHFFAGLMDVSICLGRAAGFRRVDVDGVLKRCLVKL